MPSTVNNLGTTSLIITSAISLAVFIIWIVAWWKIYSKAGYSGALSLLLLIPIANIIVFLVLAFGKWPMQKELEQLRQQGASRPMYGSSPQYPPYQQPQQYRQYQQPQQPPQYPQR